MPDGTASWALLVAVVLFIVFVLVKSRFPLVARGPSSVEGRKRVAELKREVKRAAEAPPAERARVLRRAAAEALEEGRPQLAASWARRADRVDPGDASTVGLLSRAMRRSGRYRALERLLWRRLEKAEPGSESYERLFDEVLELYEGPLRRTAQARVLRRLRAAAGEGERSSPPAPGAEGNATAGSDEAPGGA